MPRPRKPTNLHLLQGTRRKDRHPDQPDVPPADLTPPGWLDEDGRREWKRIAPKLLEHGILTELDSEALGNYCQSLSLRNRALQEIDEHGITLIAKARDGAIVRRRNPATAVLNDALAAMKRYGVMFGLDPSSRSGIKAGAGQPMTEEQKRKHELAKRLFKPT